MADDSVLEEAMENLREAGQKIRATQHLLIAQGMTEAEAYRELITRLSIPLAMTEAAYLEARRRLSCNSFVCLRIVVIPK